MLECTAGRREQQRADIGTHSFTTVEYLVLEQQPYIVLEQQPYIVLQHRNMFTIAIHSAPIELEHMDPPTIGSF